MSQILIIFISSGLKFSVICTVIFFINIKIRSRFFDMPLLLNSAFAIALFIPFSFALLNGSELSKAAEHLVFSAVVYFPCFVALHILHKLYRSIKKSS
jgi:hypothetical protein